MTAAVETTETVQPAFNVRERRDSLSVSRSALAELTGLTPAAIWRTEDGRPKGDEMAVIGAALDRVERDGLPDHLQRKPGGNGNGASKSALEDRIRRADALLVETDGKKIAEIRALVEQARAALAGSES